MENQKKVYNRINLLLDLGAPFLELSPLAGQGIDGAESSGIVTGIGNVAGKLVMIIANDSQHKGGTYFPITVKKHLRAQQIALENQLPCIHLVDSGGAFLPLQERVFPDREHFGRIFFNQARLSSLGIPQVAGVLGSCTAGGAYVPAMCEEVVMVQNQATVFLAGPPLVKAATGEEVSAEELGGGLVHSTISGVSDHLAGSEEEAIIKLRTIASRFNPVKRLQRKKESIKPKRKLSEAIESMPKGRGILNYLVDDGEFDEFKSEFGKSIICGFAFIDGYHVGILINDGVLFSDSALKATHFVELCEQRRIPLLFLQDITGFMVGKKYEHEGIAKHGAKMVTAVSNATVPKITVIVGNSYGAGNYAMCGRAYDPRFLFMLPDSKIGVMGGAQAAGVLTQIKRSSLLKKGELVNEEDLKTLEEVTRLKYEQQNSAEYSTANLLDDGIILPYELRRVLALSFSFLTIKDEVRRVGVYRF